MYLMIQNKGVAPVESFTLLGASTTRGCGTGGTIGQFGTGTKHSINLLLRKGLHFRICCGKSRLDFDTEAHCMDDGLTSKDLWKVFAQFSGASRKRIDLGWVLDFGALDWNDLGMALREFISNAIDRTIREFDDFLPHIESGDLCVKVVDDNQVKARDGYTRVFIKVDEEGEVLKYLSELPKRFLHFSRNPEQVKETLLPKAGRNLSDTATPMIYREGVFVREVSESDTPSIYDYNFKHGEIDIDDCRNSNEYSIRAACARRLRNAGGKELVPVLRGLGESLKTFETTLDIYYLAPSYPSSASDEQQDAWTEAWDLAYGEGTVAACDNNKHAAQYASRKGHRVAVIPAAWETVMNRYGITTTKAVLDDNEQKGRTIIEPTEAAVKALDIIWDWCDLTGLTNGKTKPQIKCYQELSTDAECSVFGFYKVGEPIVYVRHDIASGVNKKLLNTTLEEVAHYITGATDNSRDFQNFFMDMIIELID